MSIQLINRKLDGIHLYVDNNVIESNIIRGRTSGNKTQYIICNQQTMDIILTTINKRDRINKLNNLLGSDIQVDTEKIERIKNIKL